MPYPGEFARYGPLQRVAENKRILEILRTMHIHTPPTPTTGPGLAIAARQFDDWPDPPTIIEPTHIFAIDGSHHEEQVRDNFPGAEISYCTVAGVLIDMAQRNALDEHRPVEPQAFLATEESSTIDAVLPGRSLITGNHHTPRESFRAEFFNVLQRCAIDEQGPSLLATYEALQALRTDHRRLDCPYADCSRELDQPAPGCTACPCDHRRRLFSTDALRLQQRFDDYGPNGAIMAEAVQVWEHVLLIALLRDCERLGILERLDSVVFFLDGPLAIFGQPAWLSAAIQRELRRLNDIFRRSTGTDLRVVGIDKTGAFADHFEVIDRDADGRETFPPRSYLLPTNEYIRTYVAPGDVNSRFGEDTYYGRKLLYKSARGQRLVVNLPMFTDEQDDLGRSEPADFPALPVLCRILDTVASDRYPNAITPLVTAHAHAAIPLRLGSHVLRELAQRLMP